MAKPKKNDSTNLIFPTKTQWETLKGLGLTSGDSRTIVSPHLDAKTLKLLRETKIDYDYGGEADVWLDVIDRKDHYFVDCVKENLEDDDE